MSKERNGPALRGLLHSAGIHQCERCGTSSDLQAHHKLPVIYDGTDDLDSLSLLCGTCHGEWHRYGDGWLPFEDFLRLPPYRELMLAHFGRLELHRALAIRPERSKVAKEHGKLVKAGLQRAKAQGKQLGRRKVGPEVQQRILELRAAGHGLNKVAKLVGCGVGTVQRVEREAQPCVA